MEKTEACVAICKCNETHKYYGVRFEKASEGSWKYTWAFPIDEKAAKREGYDSIKITGEINPDTDYPGCPYCGAKHFIVCSCGHLNCNNAISNYFVCEWCGEGDTLVAYEGEGFASGGDI